MITLTDVRASCEGTEILRGVSVAFPAGKISVILGPNGCGKSTTLRTIVRLNPLDSGGVTVDGRPLEDYSHQELARKIAYLPQSRNVPEITVGRLVMHGRFPYLSYPRRYRPEDREKVRQAMNWVGLEGFSGRSMSSLSGGQRQKAYLAMAIAQDTDVILMDEPTTFLDIKNQFELLNRARMLAEMGKTVVMILHDFDETLHYADFAVLMDDGVVKTAGEARAVLDSREIREAFRVTPCFLGSGGDVHCFVRE